MAVVTLAILGGLTALMVAVLVLVLAQALYTKRTAIRLPEASGDRLHQAGNCRTLLHIGESTVAGVGVESIETGLTAAMVSSLKTDKVNWDWEVLGSNGSTISESLDWPAHIESPDVLVITFGVNDTTHFTGLKRWYKAIHGCVDRFASEHTLVFFTAVPPMQEFPLLPFPLNRLLGWRAAQLNQVLAKLCDRASWNFVPMPLEKIQNLMAEDGYHPNRQGYALWGELMAEEILKAMEANRAVENRIIDDRAEVVAAE